MKLESSNHFLENAFLWATEKTKQFVVTGRKNGDINKGDGGKWYGPDRVVIAAPTESWAQPKDYSPAFWAGYFDRTAYYIRDFVHQAAGAYLVGLHEELYSMFYTFVSHATEETGWFAPWAFNFDNSVYFMDTPNYREFVREITAQFELVETAYKLYLWSADKRYVENEVIFHFIEKIMTDFIDRLDGAVLPEKNGIPEGFGDIFKITATYNERGFHAAEAGDSIASMYRAILCYAEILKLRGNGPAAEKQRRRAEALREYFNTDWSRVPDSDNYAYAVDNFGRKHDTWYKNGTEIHGGAALLFIPMKGLSCPGERNDKLLDYIFACELDEKTREDNIESLTYLPEVFFPYHQNDRAWFWMKHILSQKDFPHERKSQGTNGDYPEISFTFISQVIEGLLGIQPDAARGILTTCPHFPADIDFIKVSFLTFGEYRISLSLERNGALIENHSEKPLQWNCAFEGAHGSFDVKGEKIKTAVLSDNGVHISRVQISVPAGGTVSVKNRL